MPIPTLEAAYAAMQARFHGQTGNQNVGIEYHSAIVQAAATSESAQSISIASNALRSSVDALKTVAEQSSKDTQNSMRRMSWMTGALIFAAVIQAGAAVAQVYVSMNQKPPQLVIQAPVPATTVVPVTSASAGPDPNRWTG